MPDAKSSKPALPAKFYALSNAKSPASQGILIGLAIIIAALNITVPYRFHLFKTACLGFINVIAMFFLLSYSPLLGILNNLRLCQKERGAVDPSNWANPVELRLAMKNFLLHPHFNDWPCLPGFLIIFCSYLAWPIPQSLFIDPAYPIFSALASAAAISLVFPLAGALSFLLGKKIAISQELESVSGITANGISGKSITGLTSKSFSLIQASKQNFVARTKAFLLQTLPYESAHLGFIAWCALISFMPQGIGDSLAGFLNVASIQSSVGPDGGLDPFLALVTKTVTALILFASFDGIAIRLSAGYQSLLQNLFGNNAGEGIIQALHRTFDAPVTKVDLPESHPVVRNVFESIAYLAACYLFLFWLVALCPISAIREWISDCVREAFVTGPVIPHRVYFFCASVVAAFGTVPFAIMTCSFLPLRQTPVCYISKQGLLNPSRLFGPKLLFWTDLLSVALKRDQLQLRFRSGKISINRKDLTEDTFATLLAAADEYSTKCSVDANTFALRMMFSEKEGMVTLANSRCFESTIFQPLKPGDFIKEYRVVRKIASKPLNAVYLVRTTNGALAVVKHFVIPQNNEKAVSQQKAFEREYQLLKELNHPMIVKVLDVFEDGINSFIALEHINGQDLRSLILERGARKEKIVMKWAEDICNQLVYLHSQNPPILHRDLTPDNLVLDEKGNIRIIDFGAAHQFMEGVTGTLIGKQSYIAPEQLRGKPSICSDIYAFGATLYFLLSGKDPKALKQCDPQALKINPKLSLLIQACTAYEENERPQSANEILRRLSS